MKDTILDQWQTLGQTTPLSLTPAIEQIHRGVQFIAMLGKHYVENQPDDSHTNLEWLSDHEVLAGHWVTSGNDKFRLAMHSKDLNLICYKSDMTVLADCNLNGKTKSEILTWVKSVLQQQGLDSTKMQMDIHYDIPHHETDDNVPFSLSNASLFAEMARHRANSDLILKRFASQYETASTVRTWPHHFDHGAYIPMAFGENEAHLKSFSIGMGIPDTASDEPYYYITSWSKTGDNDYTDLPELPAGQWISSPFNGAILKASEIVAQSTAEAQAQTVSNFLEAGIKASLHILKLS